MVLVWMMQLVSPFCQYWLEVVTVRVTLQPVRAIAVATIAARVIMMNFFILLMFFKNINLYKPRIVCSPVGFVVWETKVLLQARLPSPLAPQSTLSELQPIRK